MGEISSSGACAPPWTLDGWQALLEREFFVDRDPNAPFIFDLEVSEDVRLWADEHDLRARLSSCVAAAIDLDSVSNVFGPLQPAWQRWSSGSRTAVPPNLPVLALTVAAATEMHRDMVTASHAYYYRLAELLDPGASHQRLLALRDRLRASFEPVAQWWCALSQWVDANPDVGINTIKEHDHFTRVGYPMSQAVIRRSDRMRLTRFFAKLDLTTLGVPTGATLISQLDIWAATPRDLSPTLLAALGDPIRRSVLAAYLHRLACDWDGVVLTPEGAAHLDIRLAIDLDDFTSGWVIQARPDKLRLDVTINGQRVTLTHPEFGSFYEWHGSMPAVEAIPGTQAVTAKGLGVSGEFRFPPLQPLRANPDVGWLSVDDVEPYTPHILLIAPSWQSQIESVLEAAARKGWRRLKQKPGTQLVRGRVVYIKVEIEDAGAFKEALAGIDPLLARALRSPAGFRPRLVHGLGIFKNLGARHYLQGGEPDLLLPIGDSPRSVPAALDDTPQAHPFHATGFPIPLRRIGPLKTGKHVLDVDGETISFDIHGCDIARADRETVLGWTRSGPSNELSEVAAAAVGDSAIAGAVVSGNMPEPYLLRRRGRQYFVSDRRGRVESLDPPPHNPLFAQVGIPEPSYWEYTPPVAAIWLVERRSNGILSVHRLRYAEPHFDSLDSISHHLWGQILNQLRGSNAVLDMYLHAWERLRQHDR